MDAKPINETYSTDVIRDLNAPCCDDTATVVYRVLISH